jgi:L-threonylcarbamoyladenylate synthase
MNEEIKNAVKVLRNGGCILFPTDTIWSIGCDATNDEAVNKLLEFNHSITYDTHILLIDQVGKLQSYIDEVPEIAYDMIELSDKPITIVYDKLKNLANYFLTSKSNIGIRVTKESFSQKLCFQFRNPIFTIPAFSKDTNMSNKFVSIPSDLETKIDYCVNYKRDDFKSNDNSIIIKLGVDNTFKIIKQ